jgi:hypothetical protein
LKLMLFLNQGGSTRNLRATQIISSHSTRCRQVKVCKPAFSQLTVSSDRLPHALFGWLSILSTPLLCCIILSVLLDYFRHAMTKKTLIFSVLNPINLLQIFLRLTSNWTVQVRFELR